MDYIVLDDFTPKSLQDRIEDLLMFSDQVTWCYKDQTSGVGNNQDAANLKIRETFQHSHDIYRYDGGGSLSPFTEAVLSNLYFIEYKFGSIEMLQRIQANLLVKDIEAINTYHPPHIDSALLNSFSMVYYVNDSDGDTVIFDRQVDTNSTDKNQHIGLTEIGRVSPKKGRAVIFNSNRFHSSSNPVKHQRRVIVNSVFTASPDFINAIKHS